MMNRKELDSVFFQFLSSRARIGFLLVLACMQLSGCISVWREDVQLGNGEIIKVTRIEKYGGGGGIGSGCFTCSFQWAKLSFTYEGKTYRWKSIPYGAVPMIVDVVDGKPVVVSTPRGGHCLKLEEGTHRYAYYLYSVHEGDGWRLMTDPPGEVVKIRNLHWFKPSYEPGLSIKEKNDWALAVRGSNNNQVPRVRIAGEASKTLCTKWE